jgi:hypothetical protein
MRTYTGIKSFEPKQENPFPLNNSEGILYSKKVQTKKAIEFEKEYHNYLKKQFDFTNTTIGILKHLTTLPRKDDLILFDMNSCLSSFEVMNKGRVYSSLGELITAKIIYPANSNGMYYFNPLFFNKIKKINMVIETILK